MADPDKVVSSISKTLRWLVIATVVLYLALAGMAAWNRIDANKVGNALCELRADQERQVTSSVDFLRENPEGIPGISAETIQQGIDNRRRTISALSGLSC